MTSEKEHIELFQAELVAEKTVGNVIFRLFANRIFHVFVPPLEKINMATIQEGYKFLDENGGGEFYNIFQFSSFSDVDPEVREWAADPDGNNYTISDAIVIDNLSQKIITDFYLLSTVNWSR